MTFEQIITAATSGSASGLIISLLWVRSLNKRVDKLERAFYKLVMKMDPEGEGITEN